MRFFGRISRSSRVGLWEMTSGLSPYSALSLVRQRIHAVRQSTGLSGIISHYFSWFPGDDFMVSPYSALSLVRQRKHGLRQSTELVVCSHISTWFLGDDFMFISIFSVELGSSADTCTASVYGACCMLSYFHVVHTTRELSGLLQVHAPYAQAPRFRFFRFDWPTSIFGQYRAQ